MFNIQSVLAYQFSQSQLSSGTSIQATAHFIIGHSLLDIGYSVFYYYRLSSPPNSSVLRRHPRRRTDTCFVFEQSGKVVGIGKSDSIGDLFDGECLFQ